MSFTGRLPDLFQSLQDQDPGHLRIVAELWQVEFNAPDARTGRQLLVEVLLNRARVAEAVGQLPEEARAALEDLLGSGGAMPWALFTRRFGAVREMGPGRRDRERPHLNPTSAAEVLWYRALVARKFFDTPAGLEEFAYLPADLLERIAGASGSTPSVARAASGAGRLKRTGSAGSAPLGRAATPAERAYLIPASDRILDHACTLLAALRLGLPADEIETQAASWNPTPIPYSLSPGPLKALLSTAGLLDASGLPQPEPARSFLETSRAEALALLARAWLESSSFNELRLLPGLSVEGEWQNDPLLARQAILDFLYTLPGWGETAQDGSGRGRPFWNLAAFVAAVRQAHPDFQRPAGDYDSWFIRSELSGEFLRGFARWDDVDGALIRYLVCGPLHWLGILDLAAPAQDKPITAFRFSAWAASLLSGMAPEGLPAEDETLFVNSDARLRVPRRAPRSLRYQLARFCTWEAEKEDAYQYRITTTSLERARQQGLRLSHLLALLRRYAETVPPPLARALSRWEERGVEARLEKATVLRVTSPELLQSLRSSRAARFLGDPLGPTAVIVKPGAWQKVLLILAEMGYLGEANMDQD